MNVTGPLPQRRGNDDVDQIDDRRFIGHHLDVVQVFALDVRTTIRIEVFEHLLHRDLVALGDFFQDLGSRRDGLLDLQTAQEPDVIDHPLVARLGRGYVNRAVVDFERQDAMTLDEVGGQRAHGLWRNIKLCQTSARPARAVRLENQFGRWTNLAVFLG
jgi:hypothetical protein